MSEKATAGQSRTALLRYGPTFLVALCLLTSGGLTASLRHAQPNSRCEWPKEAVSASIHPGRGSWQQHLSYDADFAEDLAIRYADEHDGPHSGHFQGMGEYGRARDACMMKLFSVIGNGHGVTQEQVRQSLGRRRRSFDAAVIISFALLFGLSANLVVGEIVRRHPPDEGRIEAGTLIVFAGIVYSPLGVMAGEMWSAVWEGFRLGTGHLSYREVRLPSVQHRFVFFFCGALLVAFIRF